MPNGAAPAPAPDAWPRAASHGTTALPDPLPAGSTIPVEFVGTRRPIFWLIFRTGLLTILTLGLYRFWAKCRVRRWYWSAIRPGRIPLEYVGEPLEKLLGFLIAVVILAFYIGVVNLLLMFGSLSLASGTAPAYALSFVGVIPIWFYARYRARRYTLARTRWRGIRFGLAPGAWGYAFRALGHWLLTLASLGLLWPRMTFWLEKYKTDRTYFGSVRLHQSGDWRMLMPHFVHAFAGGAFTAMTIAAAASDGPQVLWLLFVTVPWFLYGIFHYQAEATGALARTKTAGDLGLRSAPLPSVVFRINAFGTLGMLVIFALPLLAIGVGVVALNESGFDPAMVDIPEPILSLIGLAAILLYFLIFILWSCLRHAVILLPLWRHYAETLTITGTPALTAISQRARDEAQQAEGFAEALDVGAAI